MIVLIAGLPGKMATLVAEAVSKTPDMFLVGRALGRRTEVINFDWGTFQIKNLSYHEDVIRGSCPDVIVDFTVPTAVNTNAELYCKCGIPFVMGTTGGDRILLVQTVRNSSISAVITPNMAPQIVAFQAMMEFAAQNFPNAFKGYSLEIWESHQASKVDTSGTARAMVRYFKELGIPFEEGQIAMVRDPKGQEILGVPREYLDGHAWHTYTLRSEDGTVLFQFTHRVNGRTIYIPGVLAAIRFLAQRKEERGKVFSMIDVLRG